MAYTDHLAQLSNGVEHWNAWGESQKKADPSFRADLGGADLRLAKLGRANLSLAELSGADLREADLSEANLSKAELIGADLRKADLIGADLRAANLFWAKLKEGDLRGADLFGANVYGADLRLAKLSRANLGLADLGGADLQSADLAGCIFGLTPARSADLSEVKNLTQDQVNAIFGVREGYGTTKLDEGHGFDISHWHVAEEAEKDSDALREAFERDFEAWKARKESELDPEPQPEPEVTPVNVTEVGLHGDRATPTIPERPFGNEIIVSGTTLSLGPDEPVPERSDLRGIYQDLREAALDLREHGNIGNLSPLLAKSISRFLDRLPEEFGDLEQIRFGAGLDVLRMQFGAERAYLIETGPEKVGYIEAVILSSNLIVARLPEWNEFLREEEDELAILDPKQAEFEEVLEHSVERLSGDPEHFDVSIFERVADYIDDKSLISYLAAKDLLLNIAHKVFTLVADAQKDIISETRKSIIKDLALAVKFQLGAVLLDLAGLLPSQLKWLVDWLKYLS